MAPYTQFILTKDSATFKGPDGTKKIKLGKIKIEPISPGFVDFTISGDKATVSFGPDTLKGGYQVIIVTPGKAEKYIPITAGLIGDAKEALTGKSTVGKDETITVGTAPHPKGWKSLFTRRKGGSRLQKQTRRTKRNTRGHKRS